MHEEIVSSYSRAEAIADGVLVDISEIAREAGFKFPVAVTQGVFALLNDLRVPCQDFKGRAWDMLTIMRLHSKVGGPVITFAPFFAQVECFDRLGPVPVELKAVCGPGADFEPVITVMLPSED